MIKHNYDELLHNEGIAGSRVDDLCEAMNKLHSALSKCDYANRRLFFNKDLVTRLKEYSKATQLADVTDIGIVKKEFCYYAPKDEKDIRIEIVTKDDPNRKVLVEGYDKDQPVRMKKFPSWDDACIYAMRKNLENGLLANDVSAIIASSDAAAKYERVEHALSSVIKDLRNEKVCRGLSVEEAGNVPAVALGEKVLDEVLRPITILVQKNADGEFRIPGPAGKEEAGACYTDDENDVLGTAQAMYGKNVVVKFKNVQEHYSYEDLKLAVDVPVKSGRSRR